MLGAGQETFARALEHDAAVLEHVAAAGEPDRPRHVLLDERGRSRISVEATRGQSYASSSVAITFARRDAHWKKRQRRPVSRVLFPQRLPVRADAHLSTTPVTRSLQPTS